MIPGYHEASFVFFNYEGYTWHKSEPGVSCLMKDDRCLSDLGAWVVADSATSVPIPGAVWLLSSGLIGIVGLRRKFKK